MLWLYLLIVTVANSEVLTFTNSNIPSSDIIQCQDAYSPCVINCNSPYVCSNHELHCHSTSPLACTINLNANYTAPSATVYAHLSSIITLTCSYQYCGQNIAVHAYERLGTQLSIDVTGLNALTSGWIYGPLGHNSFLSMRCGDRSCKSMRIFDDWTTTVRLESVSGKESFSRTVIRNIFDADVLGISRSDYGTGPAMKYRGFVYIIECFSGKDAFSGFRYFGVNHGGWYIRVEGSYSLMYAYLYMITDNRVDQSVQYPVKMYGKGGSNLRRLTRFEFGVGADGFIEAIGEKTLFYSNIYARNAHSLTIWCRGITECSQLMIEAPQTNNPNSFNFICDDPSICIRPIRSTVEILNGYACSNYYISSRIDTIIYCGYNQTTQNSSLYLNHTSHWDPSCGTQCPFDNPITPVSIATEMDGFCDPNTVIIDSLAPTGVTTNYPTTSPSQYPTDSPTKYPTKSPSDYPTKSPSDYPTKSPSDYPTKSPTKYPTKSPTKYPTKPPTTTSPSQTATVADNPSMLSSDTTTIQSPTTYPSAAYASQESPENEINAEESDTASTTQIALIAGGCAISICIVLIPALIVYLRCLALKEQKIARRLQTHKQGHVHVQAEQNDKKTSNKTCTTASGDARMVFNVKEIMSGSVKMTKGNEQSFEGQKKNSIKLARTVEGPQDMNEWVNRDVHTPNHITNQSSTIDEHSSGETANLTCDL